MTFPATYNLSRPKEEGIICAGAIESIYNLGVTDLTTPGGHHVRGYSAERSLCDILRPRHQTDIQIVSEAFKRYTARQDQNIPLLSAYARRLRVENRLRAYLEVLL